MKVTKIYSYDRGKKILKAARKSIELCVRNPDFARNEILGELAEFNQRHGVFVTIRYMPTMAVRGKIGFPMPALTVCDSVVEAAVAAACDDPLFVPLSEKELDEVIVEVALLSEPSPMKGGAERVKEISIGRDGAMARYGTRQGIVLPSEAVEMGLDAEGLLNEACGRAGMPKGYWNQPNVNIYKFETQVFKEETPNGMIVEGKF